jgi:NOL1/NOP2/fmu family ribosome biogenesis protein
VVRKDDRLASLASLQVESVGLPLLRLMQAGFKPTSVGLQVFGTHADRNTVSLRPTQLIELVEKREIGLECSASPGYVIVRVEAFIIGCGLCIPGRLVSQLPRHLSTTPAWQSLASDCSPVS